MIVKNKKEKKERHWLLFLLILLFSILIIYLINNIRIKVFIPFGHIYFLYLFDNKLYFLIIIIVFNYGNIYQALLLFYSLIIPEFLISFLFLCFEFDKQNELNIFYDFYILFTFYIFLAHILFDNNYINNNNIYKGLFLYIIIFIFLLICSTNTLAILNYSNIILLDKIISALLLSLSSYFFIFHVINIDPKDSLQLFHLIDNINNNIITVSFFIMIIISIYLNNDNKYNRFLSFSLIITSNIIPIYGIIYEYKFLFNSSRKNWANFNFEKETNNENDNINSLISDITITKSIKWNKTTFFFDFLRLLVLIFINISIFYFSEKIIIYKTNKSFLCFVFSIFTFIIDKILLYWLNLINMTYFFLERNSINSK